MKRVVYKNKNKNGPHFWAKQPPPYLCLCKNQIYRFCFHKMLQNAAKIPQKIPDRCRKSAICRRDLATVLYVGLMSEFSHLFMLSLALFVHLSHSFVINQVKCQSFF